MTTHTGKTCPYCKFTIKPDIPIVVCSDCEIPHHVECWDENEGCTTYGCKGTAISTESISEPDAPNEVDLTVKKTKICPYCAEEILEAAIKCKHCKTVLVKSSYFKDIFRQTAINNPGSIVQPQRIADVNNSHLKNYYKEEFNKIYQSEEKYKGKWNWAAFSFTFLWALSKGLWLSTVIWVILSMVTAGIAGIIYWFYLGIRGNYLYYSKYVKKKQLPF